MHSPPSNGVIRPLKQQEHEESAKAHHILALKCSISEICNVTTSSCHALFISSDILALLFFISLFAILGEPAQHLNIILDFAIVVGGVGKMLNCAKATVI